MPVAVGRQTINGFRDRHRIAGSDFDSMQSSGQWSRNEEPVAHARLAVFGHRNRKRATSDNRRIDRKWLGQKTVPDCGNNAGQHAQPKKFFDPAKQVAPSRQRTPTTFKQSNSADISTQRREGRKGDDEFDSRVSGGLQTTSYSVQRKICGERVSR